MDSDSIARLFYLLLLLVAVGGWVLVEYRKRMGEALRTAAAWGLIFIGVMAGYGLWNDLRSDIAPRQMISDAGAIEVPRAEDGHYYLTLEVNGTPVQFLADTGATNMVLSDRDARRVGIDPAELMYLGTAQTANGTVRTARVELPSVTLGPHTDANFPAWVNQGEMTDSLLGMDYLSLYRVEIAGDRMILRR
ncbi:retropepsin-like aspartic protease family protein [Paragemmobacter ruber]|uniref:TIGR02281 family clan AA aspartic protease n=1 Tax=Paragemmobacter ruber TaxID=1985673 RepID=A0ABW9Y770_9RHOB|nr:TIGR02281 family clan AA aspartic protease [Rhodobacter ruber]NBE08378.1 TIGR02281 family clan AA aspartic protease [Rhodobacter ruber]